MSIRIPVMTHIATHLNTRGRRLISFYNTDMELGFNTLRSRFKVQGLHMLPTDCIHVPFMIIAIISDYFHIHQ